MSKYSKTETATKKSWTKRHMMMRRENRFMSLIGLHFMPAREIFRMRKCLSNVFIYTHTYIYKTHEKNAFYVYVLFFVLQNDTYTYVRTLEMHTHTKFIIVFLLTLFPFLHISLYTHTRIYVYGINFNH